MNISLHLQLPESSNVSLCTPVSTAMENINFIRISKHQSRTKDYISDRDIGWAWTLEILFTFQKNSTDFKGPTALYLKYLVCNF